MAGDAVATRDRERVARMAGNGVLRIGAGWIEWGARFPKNLRPGKRAHDSMGVNHGMISSMETGAKITEKNERDLMQKENQQSGVDSVSDCDIVLSCGTESPPAQPDLS